MSHCRLAACCRPVFTSTAVNLRQLAPKDMLHKRIEAAYRHALQQPSTLHILLQPLSVAETRQLMASLVGGEVGSLRHTGRRARVEPHWSSTGAACSAVC